MTTSSNGWHRKNTDTPAEQARRATYRSPAHRAQRAAGAREVASGTAHCWRCGIHIPRGAPWHAGHDDNDRTIYRGVECPPCNLKTAARRGAATRNTQHDRQPRQQLTPRRHTRTW